MTTNEPVAEYLRGMDATRRHEMLLSFFQYPKTAKLNQHDKPVTTCHYSCTNAQCDFQQAFRCIAENIELRAFRAQPVLLEIVKDIAEHQDDHLAHVVDGFQVCRSGFDLLRLQRVDQDDKPHSNSRTGFIEYNDVRSKQLEEQERKRQQLLEKAAIRTAAAGGGCIIL